MNTLAFELGRYLVKQAMSGYDTRRRMMYRARARENPYLSMLRKAKPEADMLTNAFMAARPEYTPEYAKYDRMTALAERLARQGARPSWLRPRLERHTPSDLKGLPEELRALGLGSQYAGRTITPEHMLPTFGELGIPATLQ